MQYSEAEFVRVKASPAQSKMFIFKEDISISGRIMTTDSQ